MMMMMLSVDRWRVKGGENKRDKTSELVGLVGVLFDRYVAVNWIGLDWIGLDWIGN